MSSLSTTAWTLPPTGQAGLGFAWKLKSSFVTQSTARYTSSIAFCCISTGVFGFPQDEAARIAVSTVRAWLDAHPHADIRVIFNVFLDEDAAIYRRLLSQPASHMRK